MAVAEHSFRNRLEGEQSPEISKYLKQLTALGGFVQPSGEQIEVVVNNPFSFPAQIASGETVIGPAVTYAAHWHGGLKLVGPGVLQWVSEPVAKKDEENALLRKEVENLQLLNSRYKEELVQEKQKLEGVDVHVAKLIMGITAIFSSLLGWAFLQNVLVRLR